MCNRKAPKFLDSPSSSSSNSNNNNCDDGGKTFGMKRIYPILSSLSHLQTYTSSSSSSFDNSNGVESTIINKKGKEEESLWNEIQDFYDEREEEISDNDDNDDDDEQEHYPSKVSFIDYKEKIAKKFKYIDFHDEFDNLVEFDEDGNEIIPITGYNNGRFDNIAITSSDNNNNNNIDIIKEEIIKDEPLILQEDEQPIDDEPEDPKEQSEIENSYNLPSKDLLFFENPENEEIADFLVEFDPRFRDQIKKIRIERECNMGYSHPTDEYQLNIDRYDDFSEDQTSFEMERFVDHGSLVNGSNSTMSYISGTQEDLLFPTNEEEEEEQIKFKYKGKYNIYYNVPRLLLGRFYARQQQQQQQTNNIDNEWLRRYILCPTFINLVVLIKYKPLINFCTEIQYYVNEIITYINNNNGNGGGGDSLLYGFPLKTLYQLNLVNNQFRYSVVWALLLRLWISHDKMKEFDPLLVTVTSEHENLQRNNFLRWQLFIDTHIDLVRYILRTGHYYDCNLLDSRKNKDNNGSVCAVKQYMPLDRNFAYAGNLPDMTSCVFAGNMWYDGRPKYKVVTLSHALIHIIASKTQPKKCQLRNFLNIIYKYVAKFPILRDFFREMLRVSLLGNYEHARCRPHFETRIKLYEELTLGSGTERANGGYNDTNFFYFLLDNDKLVFQATKEFYMYNNERNYALDMIMQDGTKDWKAVREVMRNSMDLARSLLKLDGIFDKVKDHKKGFYESIINYNDIIMTQTESIATPIRFMQPTSHLNRLVKILPLIISSSQNAESILKNYIKTNKIGGPHPVVPKTYEVEEEEEDTEDNNDNIKEEQQERRYHDEQRNKSVQNRYSFQSIATFHIIDEQMEAIHKRSIPYITKLKKGSFLDVIYSQLDVFYEKNVIDPRSTLPSTSEMHVNDEQLIEDIHLVARKIVHLHSIGRIKDGYIPIKYAKHFGISEETFNLIRKLEFFYEAKNVPDNAIPKYLMFFYETQRRDFFVYHSFIRAIMQYRTLRRYPLSFDYYHTQRNALRLKLMKLPWEPLEDDDDIYHYCPNCKRFKNPVADPTHPKFFKNVYSNSFERAIYNVNDEQIYCTKDNVSSTIKDAMSSGTYYSGNSIKDKKLAKVIRKHKEVKRCCETPLVPVHMLGWIQQLDRKKWILCSICARPTIYDASKFGPLGVTCSIHGSGFDTIERELSLSTSIQRDSLEYRVKQQQLKSFGIDASKRIIDFINLETNEGEEQQLSIIQQTTEEQQEEDSVIFNNLNRDRINRIKHANSIEKSQNISCLYCGCSLTFNVNSGGGGDDTIESKPRNLANKIMFFEDRTPSQIHRQTNHNNNSNNNNNEEHLILDQRYRIVNGYLCETDFNRARYKLEYHFIMTRNDLFMTIQRSTQRYHNNNNNH